MKRHLMVAFEGVAGAGKTTTAHCVKEILGDDCVIIEEFPADFIDGCARQLASAEPFSGSGINSSLSQTFILAANACHKMELAQGSEYDQKIVILDRGIESVIAYQSVILRRKYAPEMIKPMMTELRTLFKTPDIVFYFDGELAIIRERLETRETEFDERFFDFLAEVKEEYEKIRAQNLNVICIPFDKPAEDNARMIVDCIMNHRNLT